MKWMRESDRRDRIVTFGPTRRRLFSHSLERTLFNTHVKDFIDRHKRTLKALHLPEGRMAVDKEELPPHPWLEIWTRFAHELKALVRYGYPEIMSEVEGESSTLLPSGD